MKSSRELVVGDVAGEEVLGRVDDPGVAASWISVPTANTPSRMTMAGRRPPTRFSGADEAGPDWYAA